jgi:hypothetical protein
MKRIIVSAIAVAAVLLSPAAARANSPAQHFEFDVAGEVLATCPSGTYTFTAGSIVIVVHEGKAASGNTNFTVLERPRGVVLVNELGEEFTLRGTNRFGGTFNANTGAEIVTATHKMSIIQAGGGVVETFNMVERFRDGQLITVHFGSCRWP